MKLIALITLSLTAIASAHPGHEGHEDWPFDDFTWGITAAAVIVGFFAYRRFAKRS